METICYLAVFLLLAAAIQLIFRPMSEIRERARRRKERNQKLRSFKPPSRLAKTAAGLRQRQAALLSDSKLPRRVYRVMTVLCAVAGFFIGRVIFNSTLISVAVGAVCMLTPMAYLSYRRTKIKNSWLERLNASMMTLSNSYLSTHDFITSIQNNLDTLDYPEPFRQFLAYITFVDSDVQSGLRRMENQVNNAYFSQWVDVLALAQKDRSLSYVSVTVVEAMRDALSAQRESDAAMYTVWRDYLLTLALIFSAPLVLKFLLADAYVILTNSLGGQIIFFALLLSVVFSVVMALRINRPLIV